MHHWKLLLLGIGGGLLLLLGGCADATGGDAMQAADTDATHSIATAVTHTPELTQPSPIALDPGQGSAPGAVYEAYLSPEQEGDDEEDTPAAAPDVFRSTAPSVPRSERTSRGHGVLAFTRDLSAATMHIAVENVDPDDIVMFHLHCGRPGQLGPIIVDFALKGDLADYFADGQFAITITNEDIEATTDHGSGVVGAFTAGCPIVATLPLDKVKTIGGMQYIAEQGELYFNLHTRGQTFFGDIRGQLQRVPVAAGQP